MVNSIQSVVNNLQSIALNKMMGVDEKLNMRYFLLIFNFLFSIE